MLRYALVLYNRVSYSEPAAAVCCDSGTGVRLLVDKLLAAGHQSFGIIAGPEDSYVSEERLRAAQERLKASGIAEVPMARGDYSYESGGLAFRALMAERETYDAIICVNDLMAIGVMDMARDQYGLKVPEAMSVVGFDGVDPARWSSYRLSSIRQPVRRMADATITMLMERIEQPDLAPERRLFAGQLVVGASARLGDL
jgi:DNA-binding LacI/PurR family transcriptional regulator